MQKSKKLKQKTPKARKRKNNLIFLFEISSHLHLSPIIMAFYKGWKDAKY